MEKLIIERTDCTPSVILNKEEEIFEISGKSLPEDPVGFYTPILDWIRAYLKNPNQKTTLIFELIYFNTASSKIFFEIFREFNLAFMRGDDVMIHWCFDEDDEDIMEAGENFNEMTKVPFKFFALAV